MLKRPRFHHWLLEEKPSEPTLLYTVFYLAYLFTSYEKYFSLLFFIVFGISKAKYVLINLHLAHLVVFDKLP